VISPNLRSMAPYTPTFDPERLHYELEMGMESQSFD
jgi:hypothetical protein